MKVLLLFAEYVWFQIIQSLQHFLMMGRQSCGTCKNWREEILSTRLNCLTASWVETRINPLPPSYFSQFLFLLFFHSNFLTSSYFSLYFSFPNHPFSVPLPTAFLHPSLFHSLPCSIPFPSSLLFFPPSLNVLSL